LAFSLYRLCAATGSTLFTQFQHVECINVEIQIVVDFKM
jgi:hypothetical protein